MRKKGNAIKNMSIDDLSERIKIIYFETERNKLGDIVNTKQKFRCTVWAKILPLTSKVKDITPERVNSVTCRVTIRYRADIEPDDEIIIRGKQFKLITPPVDVESRHIYTEFDCIEVLQDGKAKSV